MRIDVLDAMLMSNLIGFHLFESQTPTSLLHKFETQYVFPTAVVLDTSNFLYGGCPSYAFLDTVRKDLLLGVFDASREVRASVSRVRTRLARHEILFPEGGSSDGRAQKEERQRP